MKRVRLTEADLVRIVRKVIKENEMNEDYGTPLSDEIINKAKELVGMTIRAQGGHQEDQNAYSGIYEIVEANPNNKQDRLNLGLRLKRLTDRTGNDIKTNDRLYKYTFGTVGYCDGETFKFTGKSSASDGSRVFDISNFKLSPAGKFQEYLTPWCKLYEEKGTDF